MVRQRTSTRRKPGSRRSTQILSGMFHRVFTMPACESKASSSGARLRPIRSRSQNRKWATSKRRSRKRRRRGLSKRLFRNVLGVFHWADPPSRARRAYFPKEMAMPWRLVSQGPVVRLFLRRHRLERLAVGPWLLSQGTDRTRAAERSEDRREAV